MSARFQSSRILLTAALLLSPAVSRAANSLSLGADYLLRGVTVQEHDKDTKTLAYYDQRLSAYLITDLSKDVEATVRVQSISPWGYESSSTTLGSRYPDDTGKLWVQNAFLRLPNIWGDRVVATVGRQPIKWGDGLILSDDDLGFNALRLQVKSPWRWLPIDLDGFTAKISESLQGSKDTDLHGASLGFDRNFWRWDLVGLWEKNGTPGDFQAGSETQTVTASKLDRIIYGARFRVNLRDAYLKGEYYQQGGSVRRAGGKDINLKGSAYAFGLGGKQNTSKFWGRFGAQLDYVVGSGDDPKTTGDDEAFRAPFATRWNGLERTGMGKYAAATFSDIRSSTSPFSSVNSTNTGLDPGTSGIQTIHFGIESTPWSQWTFLFDYFTYKADRTLSAKKDLGTEFDYAAVYRYSGLVTLRGNYALFNPKGGRTNEQKAHLGSLEVDLRF